MAIKLVSLEETNGLALSIDGKEWASYGKMTAAERREWLGSVAEGSVKYAGKLSERRKEAIEKCLNESVVLVVSQSKAAIELSERMVGQ
ncbi:hypothetical protein [Photobacterium lutimaris]|uniref:Uncharacterized protein n=1 Tax=Photobacterium lutimaris TaxID=388278 RepID=A0A2T3J4P2_9GAMM|nr:hypothetical protein [Photobacterium lutimaris]PSU36223.1 hypothetical protein C9I99_04270 [Photobacterium lutimaris]TDR74903.1 hypothetical protein DFP78_106234 [Photobacterium lutimaris]